ncbi:MAG: hypothetical protein JSU63_11195, partial [Phycisphaerales bacterium]
ETTYYWKVVSHLDENSEEGPVWSFSTLGGPEDCNGNSIPDLCEIDVGDVPDCNNNDIPDGCDLADCAGDPACDDCDGNTIPDGCDISAGTHQDCNSNGIPDFCDIADCVDDPACDDCDGNTVPDGCDISFGTHTDCNSNGIPDQCDTDDCTGDPWCSDCNTNGVIDWCDIDADPSSDSNGNGIPDECEAYPPGIPAEPHEVLKNRYISIDPSACGSNPVAINVTLSSMKRCTGDLSRACIVDADCPMVCSYDHTRVCTGEAQCPGGTCDPTEPCIEHPDVGTALGWVGEPFNVPDGCAPAVCGDEDWIARVVPEAVYRVWTESVLHIGDCEVVPGAAYELRATPSGVFFTDALTVGTIAKPEDKNYGDVVGSVDVETGEFTPPDGFVSILDVQAFLLSVQNYPLGSPWVHRTWIDLHGLDPGTAPNYIANVSDLTRILFGNEGMPYTQTPNQEDPTQCP